VSMEYSRGPLCNRGINKLRVHAGEFRPNRRMREIRTSGGTRGRRREGTFSCLEAPLPLRKSHRECGVPRRRNGRSDTHEIGAVDFVEDCTREDVT
jgi:hypothetical protein